MENNDTSFTQIFIAKIHPRVTERDLKYKFKKFGEIQDVRLKRGYAFIDFENPKDAQEAVERMNGKEVEGQPIVVQPSSRKRDGRRDEDNSDNNRTSRRGPLPEDKCFNCEKTGHWANECREPKRSRFSRRDRDLDDFKCFSCGERGHKQRFCSKNNRRGNSRDRHHRRRRSLSKSRSRSSSSDSRSRSRSHSRSRSRSHSVRARNNHRNRSVSRSDSRRNYRRRSSENGKKN